MLERASLRFYTVLSKANVSPVSLSQVTEQTSDFSSPVKGDAAHTVGVEFGTKITDVGGKDIKFQIWDTGTDRSIMCTV